ncbi:MAG: dUTP pyrophosphatase [Campylobacterota bacterium]|nr:dUTP pyrophosphatase [Campylobacterota bacterium]
MFKVLDPICEPKRATKHSAGVDLFAREDIIIQAGETKIVPLGVKIDVNYIRADMLYNEFMSSHYIALFIRSSLAVKGLIIPNGQGVIDLDYPEEIGLILHNPIKTKMVNPYTRGGYTDVYFKRVNIAKGDKIAQAMLMEHKSYLMRYESDVVRAGGFGSSGEKR